MTDERRYGMHDWIGAYDLDPPASFGLRRQVADRLAALGARLVRAELDEHALQRWLDALEALEVPMAACAPETHLTMAGRIVRGEATQHDVLMNFDFDAATGHANPAAPRLDFVSRDGVAPDGSRTLVEARVTLGDLHGGGPGNAHGGILAAMLDVVLARVQYLAGYMGVTGYLNVRYLQPTPLHEEITLRAWPASTVGRKARIRGGIWLGDVQTAEAEALFISKVGGR